MHDAIISSERLCVCLRYLVTGDAQITTAASYKMKMSATVVGRIINETCEEIVEKGLL